MESSLTPTRLIARLCEASREQFINPHTWLTFPEQLEEEVWHFSPELISLYGTPLYEALSETEKKRLSFFEAVNFFSLNINGEKAQIAGMSGRLYAGPLAAFADYLHHFIDEENKHMFYFGSFCTRYAKKIYRHPKLSLPRSYAPGEEVFLFFLKILVFEAIADSYNVRMGQDDRLHPVARKINLYHHRDEARHLVFGQVVVKQLFEHYRASWTDATLLSVRDTASRYFQSVFSDYYQREVYADAGLADPKAAWQLARAQGLQLREEMSAGCVRFLREIGILLTPPVLTF